MKTWAPSVARVLMTRPSRPDVIGMRDLLAELGDAAIDGQAPGADPFFDRTA